MWLTTEPRREGTRHTHYGTWLNDPDVVASEIVEVLRRLLRPHTAQSRSPLKQSDAEQVALPLIASSDTDGHLALCIHCLGIAAWHDENSQLLGRIRLVVHSWISPFASENYKDVECE